MMVAEIMTEGSDGHDLVLDLSVNKKTISNNEIVLKQNQNLSLLLSPPSSSSSSSSSLVVNSTKQNLRSHKRALEPSRTTASAVKSSSAATSTSNKRPLRFQCKHCDYKAPSTSLMQNHIYRHTDLTPYACAYCGHKSTTKSTIMVHIELCHPNMEVKILENRVREQDFYRDLNSTDIHSPSTIIEEPQTKKVRHLNQYDSESTPINGVAISLKNLVDDGNESSSTIDEISESENLEPISLDEFPIEQNVNSNTDVIDNIDADRNIREDLLIDLAANDSLPTMVKPTLKIPIPTGSSHIVEPTSPTKRESDSDDGSEYLLVYNRPKQYYGSLYEPDKQYACKLCSYTTNHRPSMEDHVFVHTNEKPYKCGYCGEEIYTRYAATYHIKYKHAGMARNFIQNKADVTQYYVNRAKKEDEKNQFKVIDTRRVKVPARHGKPTTNNSPKVTDVQPERINPSVSKASTPSSSPLPQNIHPPISTSSTSASSTASLSSSASTAAANSNISSLFNQISSTTNGAPDYRLLLAWSYYLATQAAWMSPMFQQQQQQQQGQFSSGSLPTDPQAIAKYLQQTMQNNAEMANSFDSALRSSHSNEKESKQSEKKSKINDPILFDVKKEDEES